MIPHQPKRSPRAMAGLPGRVFLAFLLLTLTSLPTRAANPAPRPILLLSIDGLKPEYLLHADDHKLNIPHLRSLLRTGAHATGVRGVLPSSTYPSHTTLLTGVSPAKHGIVSNHPFDPAHKHPNRWYWYTQDVRVPTLWEVAASAGYTVGSVSWPVSVGARGVHFNIVEYNDAKDHTDLKLTRALLGPDVMDALAAKAGPYTTDVNEGTKRDWARTRYAAEIIRQKQTRFMSVHLAAVDGLQHRNGPFHPTVLAALEEIDQMVGQLTDTLRALDPAAVICVVSDHGFSPVTRQLKLDHAFVQAGLIELKSRQRTLEDSGVANWTAMPWGSGGSAAVLLKDPADTATRDKVRVLLDALAADPANGIARILDKPAIAQLGGDPSADFWVDLQPGTIYSSALGGPVAAPNRPAGTHSYSPTHPEMNSTFVIAGPGIPQGLNLGTIDMRQIAPTLAKLMNAPMPSAELPAVDFTTNIKN